MSNRIVIVGFGNIGQAVSPLLRKEFSGWQISAIDCHIDSRRIEIAEACEIELLEHRIGPDNFAAILGSRLAAGDFLLNLAPSVSTCDLLTFAQSKRAIYLDTGVEPWEYDYDGANADTSNYALREQVLALKRKQSASANSTAIVASGANPGYVSALVKQGLLELAHTVGLTEHSDLTPQTRGDWARLACAHG